MEGCELAASLPLWSDFCALALGLSRQFLNSWMRSHPHHDTTAFLLKVREGFASSLASAALNGAVSPVPAIFTLKAQAGWRDSGADEDSVVEIETEDSRSPEEIKKWLLASYGISEEEWDAGHQDAEDATEDAPEITGDVYHD